MNAALLKRYEIVEETNKWAEIINDLYTAWHQIKTDEQQHEWARVLAKVAYFGTYKQFNLLDMLEKFNAKKGVMENMFRNEVKVAYEKFAV